MADFWTEVLADSPKVAFKFDEVSGNLTDYSGLSHTGTASGTLTYGASGPNGTLTRAVDFGGGGFSVADHADVDLGDGPFSIMILYKRRSASASGYLCGKTSAALATSGYVVQVVQGGTDSLRLEDGSTSTHVFNNSLSVDDTNWHLVHYTHEAVGHTGKFYLDGTADTNNSSKTFTDNNFALYIGDLYAGRGNQFDGFMAGFAVWKSELTAARVTAHYSNLATSATFRVPDALRTQAVMQAANRAATR